MCGRLTNGEMHAHQLTCQKVMVILMSLLAEYGSGSRWRVSYIFLQMVIVYTRLCVEYIW